MLLLGRRRNQRRETKVEILKLEYRCVYAYMEFYNGFSMIPHEANGYRLFARRKPGKARDVETIGNRRDARWLTDCNRRWIWLVCRP